MLVGDIDALQQRIPRNTTRVAGPAHFIALRDIFHTRSDGDQRFLVLF